MSAPDSAPQTYPLSLHVPGLLRLLGEHLYAEPRTALRELIQNAHDACQRRATDWPTEGYAPRVDIRTDPATRTLTVADNGSGLTEDEIHRCLATIGQGATAGLRERLAAAGRAEAVSLIGQFGLGLLAAFMVARQVTVRTRSAAPGAAPLRWESAGGATYTLGAAGTDMPVGAAVTLHLSPGGEFLLNEGIVRDVVRAYADFLPLPITVNGSHNPANRMAAPWNGASAAADYERFVAEWLGEPDPLTVLPLYAHSEPVGTEEDSGTVVTPLAGVLVVPEESVLSVREHGEVALFVRRMLVNPRERDLLPRWARFVRGVVESPVLSPTASREQVRRDDAYYAVQRGVEAQLLAHFSWLASHEPGRWRRITAAHSDLIKAWALESTVFFDMVCDVVPFDTSAGPLALPEIVEAGGGQIYAFTEARGAAQEKMLYEAAGLVVVNASHFAEWAFLEAYASARPAVELVTLEPGAPFLFEPQPESARWRALARYFEEQGIPTRVVRFAPAGVPAVVVHPPGADELAETSAALADGRLPGAVAELVEAYLGRAPLPGAEAPGVLHVNAGNPLIQQVAALPAASPAFSASLEIVYQYAASFAGRALSAQAAQQGFDLLTHSLTQLVKAASGDSE